MACIPETDGGVVGGDAVVLVAVLLLVHDTATSPENTTIAKASRFILLIPTPHRADHGVRFDSFDPTRRGVVDDAGRGLDDLARTAPKNRTAEQTRLLNELVQTRAAIGLVGTAIGDANRVAAALPDDAARVASATSRLNVGDDLSRMSRQVLEDVACDAAAGFLFPSERDGLEQAGHQRVVPDVADAAGQSIVDYVFQELAGILGGSVARNAVAWQQCAGGILEKRNQYAAGMQGVIQSPN